MIEIYVYKGWSCRGIDFVSEDCALEVCHTYMSILPNEPDAVRAIDWHGNCLVSIERDPRDGQIVDMSAFTV